MLNRSKLVAELTALESEIFADNSHQNSILHALWEMLIKDSLLKEKLAAANVPWLLPTWNDAIDYVAPVMPIVPDYDIVSIDGSQIYPDRHSGASCYLINIGGVIFRYGAENPVTFYTKPYVFSGNDQEMIELSTELINGKRQELELYDGLAQAKKAKMRSNHLLLFDGSLIFWHLEAKDPVLKELFLSHYLATLFSLYQEKIIFASYISAPKSRELINVVRAYGCDFDVRQQEKVEALARFTDAGLLYSVLKESERTNVFKNHAKVSALYPDPVQPYFFYVHVGSEIGRVEIPAWIAHVNELVDWVAGVIIDQSKKGYGYPIVLAEAHEQAVVKGPDREFFYHLLQKMSIENNRCLISSVKLMKKRAIGI